jgi:hypothetical protein
VIGWMNALLKRGGASLAALVSAAVVNAGLAAALIGLGGAGGTPDSGPRLAARPIEVAWDVPDPPKPEPRPLEHQETPASACEPLTEPTPPSPRTEAGADMSPLSLDVALDLPDLPPLHVDPAAVLESIDWSTLTAEPVPVNPRSVRPALPVAGASPQHREGNGGGAHPGQHARPGGAHPDRKGQSARLLRAGREARGGSLGVHAGALSRPDRGLLVPAAFPVPRGRPLMGPSSGLAHVSGRIFSSRTGSLIASAPKTGHSWAAFRRSKPMRYL